MDICHHIYPALANVLHDTRIIADHAVFDCAAPVDRLEGRQGIETQLYQPLARALAGVHRRDLLCIGGINTRAAGGEWIAGITHYTGNFVQPLWGIAPSGHLVMLRSGEFYRIEHDKIVEAKILFDLPDLARQAGQPVLPHNLGSELLFPPPATQDGILPTAGDGKKSLEIVEGMFSDLSTFDPEDFSSANQTGEHGCWHEQMMWYGPGGIGSNFGWDGFVQDHRASFLYAFPDRQGGNHFCRIADGNYVAVSGWPSMHMTFQHDYLGMPADGRPLTLRVMDFYRCDGRQICENWVCLDMVDLVRQMGKDLFTVPTAQ